MNEEPKTAELLSMVTRAALPTAAQQTMAELYGANPLLKMLTENVSAAEVRPPPEYAKKPLHWVRQNDRAPTVLHWQPSSMWWTTFGGQSLGAKELHRIGYRYLGPAEWREPARVGVDALVREYTRLETDSNARIAALESELARLKGADLSGEDLHDMAFCLAGVWFDTTFGEGKLAVQSDRDGLTGKFFEMAYHAYLHCGYAGPAARERWAELLQSAAEPYSPEDKITITGGSGSGATATLEVKSGVITSITITNGPPPSETSTAKSLPAAALRSGDGIPR